MSTRVKISSGTTRVDKAREKRLNDLAYHVSLLPWFNIDILHKIYINILEKNIPQNKEEECRDSFEMRAITCADLLCSPDVKRIDYNTFEIEEEKRDLIRKEVYKDKKIISEIGKFMIAYAQSNHHHFLSPRYREALYIGGRVIIDPNSAARDISSKITQEIGQNLHSEKTEKIAEYYLNIINKNSRSPGILELKKYLEGTKEWTKGNREKAMSKFRGLKIASDKDDAKTITVKLPSFVQKEIIENFKQRTLDEKLEVLEKGICLVDVNKRQIGNGILLKGGFLLTAHHLLASEEDAKNTRISFQNRIDNIESTYGVDYTLDPDTFFITMFHDDIDFTIVKIKDHPIPTLQMIKAPKLSIEPIGTDWSIHAIQVTPQSKFKSKAGEILEVSDLKVYHDAMLDLGSSGSPVANQEGEVIGMTVASNRAKGGSRVESILIQRIATELQSIGMDINNLEAQTRSSDLHCILVGNNEYQSENIYPLIGAINDAKKMRHFIRSNLRYSYF